MAGSSKRPILVWVISIFVFLSSAWALYSIFLVTSGGVPLTPEQQQYFDNLSTFDYASSIAIGLLNVAGAVALLLLRKEAFPLFAGSLGLNILVTIWHALAKNWLEAIGQSGLVGVFIGLGIAAAVCFYAWHLKRTGVLS